MVARARRARTSLARRNVLYHAPGPVAQRPEQPAHNRSHAGSNPAGPTRGTSPSHRALTDRRSEVHKLLPRAAGPERWKRQERGHVSRDKLRALEELQKV